MGCLEQKPPLTSLKRKWREVNCLFLSYSSSKRRGKVFGSKIGCLCFKVMRESSLMLNLVVQRQKLYEMLSLLSYTRLLDLRSHRCVKEGKVVEKGL